MITPSSSNNVNGPRGEPALHEETSTIVQDLEANSSSRGDGDDDATEGVAKITTSQHHWSIIQQHALTMEDPKSPPTKHECTKLVLSLSKEVAIFSYLSIGVGGTGDCNSLREELKCLGTKVFDLLMLCKRRLMPLLLSKRVKEEERVELERLYRIFSGCLEMLHTEFIRAIALQSLFPIWDSSTLLIQTGITEWMVTKKCLSKTMSGDQMILSDQEHRTLDAEEFMNLEKRVAVLQELSYSTSQIMDIKPWDHMPDPDLTKINMETSDGAELELPAIDGSRRPKHRKCIILTLIIGSLVIVAGVLGLALALPNDETTNSSTPKN